MSICQKPNPNSNSIQLGLRLDFVSPLSQEQEEEQQQQEQQQPTTSVVHDGVKRVMPECVVGQKRPKENDKLATTQMKNKKAKKGLVSLSHLDDDEVDDV